MLAQLLALLPACLTGRIEPRARRQVTIWTKDNATLRTLRYGWARRILFWGSNRPVSFALLLGVVASCVSYSVAIRTWGKLVALPAPTLKADFDIASYTGVPWSVQATLVALVYPIVLSFIALMLQRRANSTSAMRAYILDCGVIPAGASSVGLLVAMGGEYFAGPYSTPEFLAKYMGALLTANGCWLFFNLLLTGFFLTRTVRFIQDDEQRHVFTRVAVDIALRSELIASVKQHLFVNAPQTDWDFPGHKEAFSSQNPQILNVAVGRGTLSVSRDLTGSKYLQDVHLYLLAFVARRWYRRAAKSGITRQNETPTLTFAPRIGAEASGEAVLCTIEHGPPLSRLERALVRSAFVYRSSKNGSLSLSTREMLDELASEAESATEQGRFSVAEETIREVLNLHKTLLLASAVNAEELAGNVATIGSSAYSWGDSSFDMEWLQPYRDLCRLAVKHFDTDARLFRLLSYIPANLGNSIPPRPEKLLIDAQNIGKHLAYLLAAWWLRKADETLAASGGAFSGTLPLPSRKVYENAMISFVGHWDAVRVRIEKNPRRSDSDAWLLHASGALVYAAHIENTAELLLKSVSRGDETASTWLFETFLKWWGNREYELRHRDGLLDYRTRNATIGLASKSWAEAKEMLWDGSSPASFEDGRDALNLTIRRYWEGMRLLVALLLVENAGTTPTHESRELRLAAALVNGDAHDPGGSVKVQPLASIDDFLHSLLRQLFGVGSAIGRLDHFAERLRWDDDAPVVTGWSYSWARSPDGLEFMARSQAVMLVSLAATTKPQVQRSKRLVERWWNDIDKLEQVDRYLRDMRRIVLSQSFNDLTPATTVLKSRLAIPLRTRSARLAAARALKQLSAVAKRERRLVMESFGIDADKVHAFCMQVATVAFDDAALDAPIDGIAFVPGLSLKEFSYRFDYHSKYFIKHIGLVADSDFAAQVGKAVRQCVVAWSFEVTVDRLGWKPLNSSASRNEWNAPPEERRAFITAVSKRCAEMRQAGHEPIVMVGRSSVGTYLRADGWGSSAWQTEPPGSISIRHGEGTGEFSFIDDSPVYDFDTPNGDCYIVPAELLHSLTVSGSNARDAMSLTWTAAKGDRIVFKLSWGSAFRGEETG